MILSLNVLMKCLLLKQGNVPIRGGLSKKLSSRFSPQAVKKRICANEGDTKKSIGKRNQNSRKALGKERNIIANGKSFHSMNLSIRGSKLLCQLLMCCYLMVWVCSVNLIRRYSSMNQVVFIC